MAGEPERAGGSADAALPAAAAPLPCQKLSRPDGLDHHAADDRDDIAGETGGTGSLG
jgi:hypothetical protein